VKHRIPLCIAGIILFATQLLATKLLAQTSVDTLGSDISTTLRSYRSWFSVLLPPGLREGYTLRSFIASETFEQYRQAVGDRNAFDALYLSALDLTHGNERVACLASAFGSFEHHTLDLKFIGFNIPVPLTTESDEHFRARVNHLSVHLYSDSIDDRDKSQHFFASAWLKHTLGMDWLVKFIGHLVEWGEDAFVVGGANDSRDVHANYDGIRFASGSEIFVWCGNAWCGRHKHGKPASSLPSDFLTSNPLQLRNNQ
jgi:hypothetical protein